MKFPPFLFALLLATQTTATARIGETYDELVQRYGKPVANAPFKEWKPQCYTFHFSRFSIGVCLLDHRSVVETFTELLPDQQHPGAYGDAISMTLSDSSKDVVLGANSLGKRWEPVRALDWEGERWDVGTEHPITKDKLLNAWRLSGEQIFSIEERRSLPAGFCVLTVFTKKWSDFRAPIAQKKREEEVKKSGL